MNHPDRLDSESVSILRRSRTVLSPWVTLVERSVGRAGEGVEGAPVFHSLALADYVTVLAETTEKEIILVEQFRPALEMNTLELPGGLLDSGEEPALCAARELAEETGFRPGAEGVFALGPMRTDTARLENRVWCFHARGVEPVAGWQPEPDVRRHLVPKPEFVEMLRRGAFDYGQHIAIVGMAMLRGRF
jgi:ADP-ribose pyrophosphatase